ncbi:MAG: hypothetical protein V2A34_16315 [Lentisphaerota bacterium]
MGARSGEVFQIFDHVGGFYLVGEGIAPDMLAPVHSLFARYCRSHTAVEKADRENPIHVQYRSFAQHDQHRLCMHFPASIGKFHAPLL